MIHKLLSLTVLVALALVLVPVPSAADIAVADATVAPFQVELIGTSAEDWVDRLVQSSSCDLQDCLDTCSEELATCITANRPNFVVCLALNDACITGCYSACS